MAHANAISPPEVPDTADLRCLQCEYQLRGLPLDGHCPECGLQITDSWRRHQLERAGGIVALIESPPRWLRMMAWGCVLLVTTAGVNLMTAPLHFSGLIVRFGWPLGLSMIATLAAALWCLAAHEPVSRHWTNRRGARWFIRCSPLASILVWFGLVPLLTATGVQLVIWINAWNVALACLYAVVTVLVMHRLSLAARRARRPRLARGILLLCWVGPLMWIAQVLVQPTFHVRPMQHYYMTVEPVIGFSSVNGFLVMSLIAWPRFEPMLLFWLLHAVMSAAAVVILVLMARLFFRGMEARVQAGHVTIAP